MGSLLFWVFCGMLLLAAWVRLRSRMGSGGRDGTSVDDDMIHRIEEEGFVVTDEDEPLDLDHVEEEERRFWEEERWDEADEW